MAYPSAEDYIRAVQNPASAFLVPAFQAAEFVTDPIWGMPVPASGTAAVVFQAEVGGEDRALRFFLREDLADRTRYRALEQRLDHPAIRQRVASARWVGQAIRIGPRTYPMIDMQWVEGQPLDAHVRVLAEHDRRDALWALAVQWRTMLRELQAAGFAHGDLQHGNVLVADGTLRLVDFDGAWIEELRDHSPPKEDGHRNYQRTARVWNRWMDTFPGLVIYIGLLGLAIDPTLWRNGFIDDRIFFCGEDFQSPLRTPTWTRIHAIGNTELSAVAAVLADCCGPDWTASGSLEDVLGTLPWWVLTALDSPRSGTVVVVPPSEPQPAQHDESEVPVTSAPSRSLSAEQVVALVLAVVVGGATALLSAQVPGSGPVAAAVVTVVTLVCVVLMVARSRR
jgi:predicted Ser/Thr protein kinase